MSTIMRLHNIIMHTTALGPGTRMAIWFQGCNRRCKGCMSPESRPLTKGKLISVENLIGVVLATEGIEGITISGGEPFLQIDALYLLLSEIRKNTNLGVIIYTGYTITELSALSDPKVNEILTDLADIIIDGEYMDEFNDGGSLKGSSNQTVNYITQRYLPYRQMYESKKRDVQVVIAGDEALLVGVPDKTMLETWQKTANELQ